MWPRFGVVVFFFFLLSYPFAKYLKLILKIPPPPPNPNMLLFILFYAKQNKINGTRKLLVECGFMVSRGLWRSSQVCVDNLGVVGQQAWCFSLQFATVILLEHKMVTLWKPRGRPWLRPREQRQLGWGGQHSWAPAPPSSKWAAPYFFFMRGLKGLMLFLS